jgi:hypothetical protein
MYKKIVQSIVVFVHALSKIPYILFSEPGHPIDPSFLGKTFLTHSASRKPDKKISREVITQPASVADLLVDYFPLMVMVQPKITILFLAK